jgi:hypothetical protein
MYTAVAGCFACRTSIVPEGPGLKQPPRWATLLGMAKPLLDVNIAGEVLLLYPRTTQHLLQKPGQGAQHRGPEIRSCEDTGAVSRHATNEELIKRGGLGGDLTVHPRLKEGGHDISARSAGEEVDIEGSNSAGIGRDHWVAEEEMTFDKAMGVTGCAGVEIDVELVTRQTVQRTLHVKRAAAECNRSDGSH